MCMDLNGHPCSFLDAHLNCDSKSKCDHKLTLNCDSKSKCDHKSCYEEASVLVEHGPNVWNSVYFNVNFLILQFS